MDATWFSAWQVEVGGGVGVAGMGVAVGVGRTREVQLERSMGIVVSGMISVSPNTVELVYTYVGRAHKHIVYTQHKHKQINKTHTQINKNMIERNSLA